LFVLMLALSSALPAFAPAASMVAAPAVQRSAAPVMETRADLESLATKLNPSVGFYDPLNLSGADFWGKGEEATIGWLRHAEIKHGRIAMFAFVGYCVQANGVHWPWNLNSEGVSFADISAAGYPNEQWDALPSAAKLQIFAAIGLLEFFGEGGGDSLVNAGEKHYTKGGKPGYYPPLKSSAIPHPVPFNLFDPFGISAKATAEKKAAGLVAEINNGRLAMLGIFGIMCKAKGLGYVPGMDSIPPYAGEVMAPFSMTNADLPMVAEMLKAFEGGAFPFSQ